MQQNIFLKLFFQKRCVRFLIFMLILQSCRLYDMFTSCIYGIEWVGLGSDVSNMVFISESLSLSDSCMTGVSGPGY